MHEETFYGSSTVSAALSVVVAIQQKDKFKLKGYKQINQSINTVQSGNLYETTIIVQFTKQ